MNTANNRLSIKDIAYIALFAALMAICAWISIPLTVPFTLQTFGVFITLTLLGGRRGTLSIIVYLLLGAVGLPVFSGFKGGIGVLFGTTGGYLVGFILSALIIWGIAHFFGDSTIVLAVAMLIGLCVCYVFGTIWFMVLYTRSSQAVGLITVLSWCVFPFIIPDIIKLVLALVLGRRLKPRLNL